MLDIKEADEEKEVVEDEDEQPVSEIDSTNFSALSDATEVESNTGNESVKFDGIDEVSKNFSLASQLSQF